MIKNYLVSYKPGNKHVKTPMIRLSSQSYLKNIVGLAIGDKLAIDYQPGEIRIRKINNESNLCSNKN